jgi:hypothetical protein
MSDLTPQQQGLLERYHRAHAAWIMAVNHEDDGMTGTAYAAARDACLAAGVDPFHYPSTAMTKQHKATPYQWEYMRERTEAGLETTSCILELRSRVEALEAAQHNPRAALDAQPEPPWSGPLPQLVTSPTAIRPVDRYELGDAIRRAWLKHGRDSWFAIADEVFAALAQPPAGSLVDRIATDAELCKVYNDAPDHCGPALRAVYDLGRRHGAAPIRSGPESPLVERVADAIAAQATSAGIVNDRPARAAILEVAAALIDWWNSHEDAPVAWEAAKWLEQEASR